MHGHMVDLKRYRVTSGGRNFIERIKGPVFLETVLAIGIMYKPQFNERGPIQKKQSTPTS